MKQERTIFFEDFDIEYYRHYILRYQKEEYSRIQHSLERMFNHYFLFDGNWDMEPCPREHQIQPMNWEVLFEEDPEWAYMLNRQEYLLNFVIGYLVEGDMRYIQKLKFFIFDWIEQVQEFSPQSLTTRTLDTGIRCFTWLKILLFLLELDLLEEKELQIIYRSLETQIHFMRRCYRDKYTLSNWGILQTIPVIAIYHFFSEQLDIEEEYLFAIEELQQQVQIQILEDGTQFEQSILYHVEVYKALLELCILLPELKHKYATLLGKMATYIQMMTGLDGKTIAFGDSDCTDTWDILNLSALVLEDEQLLSLKNSYLDPYSLLLVGRKGADRLATLKAQKQGTRTAFFKDSGQVCIQTPRSHFFFKNGPMGSAHTHSDQNSFCLQDQGELIFVDSGRYTYREIGERSVLKSAWSHTGCILDETPPEIVSGSWDYENYPQSLFCGYQENAAIHYVEGSYLASNPSSYLHTRKIIMLEEGVWLVIDDIRCAGDHKLRTQFILDSQVIYSPSQVNNLKLWSEIPLELEKTFISKKYNELEESSKLVKIQEFSDRIIDATLIADQSFTVKHHKVYQTDGGQLPNALAIEIENNHTNKLILVLNDDLYKGEKLCVVDGVKMRGKCVVYDKKTCTKIRLKC